MCAERSEGRRTSERAAGYTLIELLVTVFLMTVVMTGAYSVLFQGQATFDAEQDAMALRQGARIALDEMASQIRMAGADIGNLPAPLVQAGTSTLVFVADIDAGDAAPPCGAAIENAVDGGAERISYSVVAGMLLRSVDCWDGANWSAEYVNQVLARDLTVAGPVFRYFDTDGNELVPAGNLTAAQLDLVRTVGIEVALQDPEDQVLPDSFVGFEMETLVQLRNIID
jgi:prepilin-type N-terminal cleavage/methylation domain-containing protein